MSRSDSIHGGHGGEDYLDGEHVDTFMVRRVSEEGEDDGSPSPRTALLSALEQSRDSLSLVERNSLRRPSRRDRDRHRSGTFRELVKLVVSEDLEVKQTRRTLNAALERLNTESQRAHEAEQRALELAARFRQANDARLTAQRDSDRVNQELQLYKSQLDVAQRELLKGQEILRDLEAQRDNADAAAARARSTARRYKEQHKVTQAREDGRLEGFKEGLRRGYEEAGLSPSPRLDARIPPIIREQRDDEDDRDEDGQFPPGSPPNAVPLAPSSITATVDDPGPSRWSQPREYIDGGAQGSRFQEHIGTPSTLASVPLPSQRQPSGPSPWPPPPRKEDSGYIHPIPIHIASPAPHHPNFSVPPDNWIPEMGEDKHISIPPPHELARPPPTPTSPSAPHPPEHLRHEPPVLRPAPSSVISRDYAAPAKGRASPRSMTDSLPSTTISDFDLLSAPRRPGARERGPVLSAIPEASTTAEFSPPASDAHSRGSAIPEPLTFPAPAVRPDSAFAGSDARQRPGSKSSRRDDVSAAGSSRRRKPSLQQVSQDVRGSIASVKDWLETQSPQEDHRRASPNLQHSPHRAYVADVADDEKLPSLYEKLPSPYERPYSAASGGSSRHRRSHSMNPASVPSPLSRSATASGHRRAASSGESITITVQLPSGSESGASPSQHLESGRLTPNSMYRTQPAPAPQFVPAPGRSTPSAGAAPVVSELPAGFMPMDTTPSMRMQPLPPPGYMTPKTLHRMINPAVEDERPVVPMMQSMSSTSSDSRTRPPRSAPQRSASRASGSMSYEPSGSRPKTPSMQPAGPSMSRPATPSQPRYIPPPSSPRMLPPPAPASSIYPDGSRWSPRPTDAPLPVPPPAQPQYIPPPSSPRMVPAPAQVPATAIYPGPGWNPNPSQIQLPVAALSPRSSTSRLSLAGNGHQRSLSMNAGSTPKVASRPLSKGAVSELRRMPSATSVSSRLSGYSHYDPSTYVDAAFLASSEDLTAVAAQSPGTWANTQQNTLVQLASGEVPVRSPSALSYLSSSRV